jgi:hypothetical protein
METLHGNPLLLGLLIAWGTVTAGLLIFMMYRGALETREDDQVFLDPAQAGMARDQQILVARIEKLSRPIHVLMIASGVLLVAVVALWLVDALKHF